MKLLLKCIFTSVAGWSDTVGFLIVAHVFVSFMSGNSTQLMVAIVQNNTTEILTMTVVIVGFVLGIVIGEVIRKFSKSKHTFCILLLESIALWGVVLLVKLNGSMFIFLPLFSFAMGMHNTSLYKGNDQLIKTYISGTLVSLGQAIGKAFVGLESFKLILNPLVTFLSFVVGSITGAVLSVYIGHIVALISLASIVSFMMACALFISLIPQKAHKDSQSKFNPN